MREKKRRFSAQHRFGLIQGLFVLSSLRMKPASQKQPETQLSVHTSGLNVHVSGQAVPHDVYPSFLPVQHSSGGTHLPFFAR